MILFKPIKIISSELSNLSIVAGQFIICADTGRMYLDIDNTTRLPVGGSDSSSGGGSSTGGESGVVPINPSDTSSLNIWIEDE